MSKQIHVTMPDGSVWAIPAQLVAESRARYYAEYDTGETNSPGYDAAYRDEVEYALSVEGYDELIDWARGDMNWGDVVAWRVKEPPEVDYQEGWVTGEMVVVDTEKVATGAQD